MDLHFLTRVQRTTAVVGVIAFLLLAVYYDWIFALGYLTGCLWGVANFWALGLLLRAVVTLDNVNRTRAFVIAGIKFPVLYVGGYFILRSEWFTPVSLVIGFSTFFVVVTLKAAGRAVLHLDERTASDDPMVSSK